MSEKKKSLAERHEDAAVKADKGEITSDFVRLKSYAPSYQGKRDTYENTLKALQEADTDLSREQKRAARAKAKGGAVKYVKGGAVKSSSKHRGDGIAQRGKTKGRFV